MMLAAAHVMERQIKAVTSMPINAMLEDYAVYAWLAGLGTLKCITNKGKFVCPDFISHPCSSFHLHCTSFYEKPWKEMEL
jgi:hypothetical protein